MIFAVARIWIYVRAYPDKRCKFDGTPPSLLLFSTAGQREPHQCGGINRLDQVVIETCLFRAASILILPPPGRSGDDDVLRPGSLPNATAGIQAVQLGQPDVQHDQV